MHQQNFHRYLHITLHTQYNISLGVEYRAWPDLRMLCVGGKGITARGLVNIAQLCQNLRALELVNCVSLTSETVRAMTSNGLKKLELVELNETPLSSEVRNFFKVFVLCTLKSSFNCKHCESMQNNT